MAEIDKSLPNDKRPEEEVALGVDVEEIQETPKGDRKSTRLNSSHSQQSRMPSSA